MLLQGSPTSGIAVRVPETQCDIPNLMAMDSELPQAQVCRAVLHDRST